MTTTAARAEWDTAYINNLPDSAFAYIEPGGKKDADGKTTPRSKRHFPIRNAAGAYDAAHVRNALGRLAQSPFERQARGKVEAAAKALNIGEPASASRDGGDADWVAPDAWVRPWFPLEDIRILSRANGLEYSDGRTVSAMVAVFDRPAEIMDPQGHYVEYVDRAAFNRAVEHARPQGGRPEWRVGVFWNHGMTLHGTPSDRGSVPLGSPVDIRVERSGLLTVTRYNNTPLAEEILETIRNGDVTGHSFTGRIVRSDPLRPPRGGYRPSANGDLVRVRRLELGLREYGPTPFPAYAETAVVSVRGDLPITQHVYDDAERAAYDPADPMDTAGTSPDGEPAPDDPPASTEVADPDASEHSSREDDDLARASILQKIALARRTRPGLMSRESE